MQENSLLRGFTESDGRTEAEESIATASSAGPRSPTAATANQRRRGTGRTACSRCKARKQRCDGHLPACWNCTKGGAECDLGSIRGEDTARARYVASLEHKVARLELKLQQAQPQSPTGSASTVSSQNAIGDVVNSLFFGPSDLPASVESPSSLSLALNLGTLVQASVWNKVIQNTPRTDARLGRATASPTSQPQAQAKESAMTNEEMRAKGAGPPPDELGIKLIEACFSRLDSTYPFLDKAQIWELHRQRESLTAAGQREMSKQQRFGLFKLYLVYAIGSGVLVLTEKQAGCSPEAFYMTALQHTAVARESRSIENIEAMLLLVIFHLRSAVSHGLWYMIGLAMRTSIDLGLHLRRREAGLNAAAVQQRRKIFWSAYSLERNIAIALGYPVSIADRQIDVELPTVTAEHDAKFHRVVYLFRLRQTESYIYHSIYRADKPLATLLLKTSRHYEKLQEWRDGVSKFEISPDDGNYLLLHYYRAVRLLFHPFLSILRSGDPYYKACLDAVGQICQIHKRLHQHSDYGHSFIAVQTVFVSGITMLYCLWTRPTEVWSVKVSNDIRACSSVLFVMGERAAEVRKYRDSFEMLVNATMDRLHQDSQPSEFSRTGDSVMRDAGPLGSSARATVQPDPGPGGAPFAEGVPPGLQDKAEIGQGEHTHVLDEAMPPPLQVLQQRWMEFDATTVLREMSNWVDQEGGSASPPWLQTCETFLDDNWEQAIWGMDNRDAG
ncbi:hypothetical protein GQ53DRAFT_727960 [Thozetella sp. PMI_491]|nr:hypothetical protein GQ53DRAFT_727960 [Thozetella sp. PMI_491]